MSPRASKSARLPVGDSDAPAICVADFLDVRAERRAVGDDLDRHLVRLLGGEVEDVHAAPGLEHDVRRTERRILHVEVSEVGDLMEARCLGVVRPDVAALVLAAIGQEVERRAGPHRLRVVGVVVRDVLGRVRVEVERPDVGRPAAAVALPGAGVGGLRQVRDALRVRRERREFAVRHGKRNRHAAGFRDLEQLVVAVRLAGAVRRDEQRLAVRVPGDDPVVAGVIGQARRFAAGRRDRVDLVVAVVVGREGDRLAVGRELGKALLAARRREPLGGAARLWHDPDVTAVDERDLRRRDGRLPQHARVDLRGRRCGKDEGAREAGGHRADVVESHMCGRARVRNRDTDTAAGNL